MLGVDFIEGVQDDLDVSMNPDTYQDQASPAPPAVGNYRVIVKKAKQRTDKEGKVVLADGKFPTITLEQLEIIEPAENARLFSPFHDLRTKPFERFGVLVSDVADFTRSVDAERGWSGLAEGIKLVDEYLDTNAAFTINVGWEAFDKSYLEQAMNDAGLTGVPRESRTDEQKQVLNAIYKKARVRTNAFPKKDGRRHHVVEGPSGEMLEAKPVITRFIPSTEAANTKLGPATVR